MTTAECEPESIEQLVEVVQILTGDLDEVDAVRVLRVDEASSVPALRDVPCGPRAMSVIGAHGLRCGTRRSDGRCR